MADKKILILDDDPDMRNLVQVLLSHLGYEVLEAGRGEIATRTLTNARPDLVIVDGLLPDTTGVAWIEALRKRGDHTPIVFLSAFWRDLETFRHLTQDLGVARVLNKPIKPEHLVQVIDEVMAERAPNR